MKFVRVRRKVELPYDAEETRDGSPLLPIYPFAYIPLDRVDQVIPSQYHKEDEDVCYDAYPDYIISSGEVFECRAPLRLQDADLPDSFGNALTDMPYEFGDPFESLPPSVEESLYSLSISTEEALDRNG